MYKAESTERHTIRDTVFRSGLASSLRNCQREHCVWPVVTNPGYFLKNQSKPGLFSWGQCLLIQKYFCTVYDYAGKTDLSMGYWNPERKLEVAGHFLEIIEQQSFSKAVKYKAMYGVFVLFCFVLSKLKLYYLLKIYGYPQFSFGYQEHFLSSAFSA